MNKPNNTRNITLTLILICLVAAWGVAFRNAHTQHPVNLMTGYVGDAERNAAATHDGYFSVSSRSRASGVRRSCEMPASMMAQPRRQRAELCLQRQTTSRVY